MTKSKIKLPTPLRQKQEKAIESLSQALKEIHDENSTLDLACLYEALIRAEISTSESTHEKAFSEAMNRVFSQEEE
jgi:hypothetical protein